MNTRNIAAVIVTFNRLDKLPKTLESTLANDFDKIVVVNNSSTDGTKEWLDTLDDARLCILHERENTGGAGGFQRGFDYVAQSLPAIEWLVCFDDDAYPHSGAISQFKAMSIPVDVGSCAAAVFLPDGDICEMNRPSHNPFWHLKEFLQTVFSGRDGFHVSDEDYQRNESMEIDTSSFVGCFVRVDLIRQHKIGLPRRELFIYADDIIYVLELRKAGFKHLFIPQVRFDHDCDTRVQGQDVYKPLWKAYFTYRNRLEMYRVAAGIFFPLIALIKIPQCFLAQRYYDKEERPAFKRLVRLAIKDGMARRYDKNLRDILDVIEQS